MLLLRWITSPPGAGAGGGPKAGAGAGAEAVTGVWTGAVTACAEDAPITATATASGAPSEITAATRHTGGRVVGVHS